MSLRFFTLRGDWGCVWGKDGLVCRESGEVVGSPLAVLVRLFLLGYGKCFSDRNSSPPLYGIPLSSSGSLPLPYKFTIKMS